MQFYSSLKVNMQKCMFGVNQSMGIMHQTPPTLYLTCERWVNRLLDRKQWSCVRVCQLSLKPWIRRPDGWMSMEQIHHQWRLQWGTISVTSQNVECQWSHWYWPTHTRSQTVTQHFVGNVWLTVERTFNSLHSATVFDKMKYCCLQSSCLAFVSGSVWLLGSYSCPECVVDLRLFAPSFSARLTLGCTSAELCSQTCCLLFQETAW